MEKKEKEFEETKLSIEEKIAEYEAKIEKKKEEYKQYKAKFKTLLEGQIKALDKEED